MKGREKGREEKVRERGRWTRFKGKEGMKKVRF